MIDISYFPVAPHSKVKKPELPKPQPFGAPVFINDVVSPLAGETVLSLLWKRLDKDYQP